MANMDIFEKQKKIIKEKKLIKRKSSNRYSKTTFVIPVPKEKIRKIYTKNPLTHIGNLSNAIDFIVPKGTEVYAAADGEVIEIKDDSKKSGFDPKYWYDGNYIVIRHNGELTEYEHLKYKGVVVKVGEKVKQGQLIGYSGGTGYCIKPHLHFEVMKYFGYGENDYVTLKARFKNFHDVYKSKKLILSL